MNTELKSAPCPTDGIGSPNTAPRHQFYRLKSDGGQVAKAKLGSHTVAFFFPSSYPTKCLGDIPLRELMIQSWAVFTEKINQEHTAANSYLLCILCMHCITYHVCKEARG